VMARIHCSLQPARLKQHILPCQPGIVLMDSVAEHNWRTAGQQDALHIGQVQQKFPICCVQ
jgi:hypothetical protein